MGGGLRCGCSGQVGFLGVLRTLPGTKVLPSCRDASPLATWTVLLIVLGSKEPPQDSLAGFFLQC